jgi:hypothetical protein
MNRTGRISLNDSRTAHCKLFSSPPPQGRSLVLTISSTTQKSFEKLAKARKRKSIKLLFMTSLPPPTQSRKLISLIVTEAFGLTLTPRFANRKYFIGQRVLKGFRCCSPLGFALRL